MPNQPDSGTAIVSHVSNIYFTRMTVMQNTDDSSTCISNDHSLHAGKLAWQTPSVRELSVTLDTLDTSGSFTDGLTGSTIPT